MTQVIQGNSLRCLFTDTPPSLQLVYPLIAFDVYSNGSPLLRAPSRSSSNPVSSLLKPCYTQHPCALYCSSQVLFRFYWLRIARILSSYSRNIGYPVLLSAFNAKEASFGIICGSRAATLALGSPLVCAAARHPDMFDQSEEPRIYEPYFSPSGQGVRFIPLF